MQAASKVASWEVSVQEGTFNDASSGVCVISSNAEVSAAVERGRERLTFRVAVERGRERVAFKVAVEKGRERVTFS